MLDLVWAGPAKKWHFCPHQPDPLNILKVWPHVFYSSPSAVCTESLVEIPSVVLEKSLGTQNINKCGNNIRMSISRNEPSNVQSWLGSVWLLPVQTFGKALAGTSIFKWHWHSRWCNVVAGGSGFWLLSCRNVITSGQMEQVHWT